MLVLLLVPQVVERERTAAMQHPLPHEPQEALPPSLRVARSLLGATGSGKTLLVP